MAQVAFPLSGVRTAAGARRGAWDLLLYGSAVLMVIAPFLFYPFAKTLFLAFDLIFRPPSPEDFI